MYLVSYEANTSTAVCALTIIVHAHAAAAVAAAACGLPNTHRRPRQGLLKSSAFVCGGRGSAPLELLVQRAVLRYSHSTPQRHNSSISHLKMHRSPTVVFSNFPT